MSIQKLLFTNIVLIGVLFYYLLSFKNPGPPVSLLEERAAFNALYPAVTAANSIPIVKKAEMKTPTTPTSKLWIDIEGTNLGGVEWRAELRPVGVSAQERKYIQLATSAITREAGRLVVAPDTDVPKGKYHLLVANAFGITSYTVEAP